MGACPSTEWGPDPLNILPEKLFCRGWHFYTAVVLLVALILKLCDCDISTYMVTVLCLIAASSGSSIKRREFRKMKAAVYTKNRQWSQDGKRSQIGHLWVVGRGWRREECLPLGLDSWNKFLIEGLALEIIKWHLYCSSLRLSLSWLSCTCSAHSTETISRRMASSIWWQPLLKT